MAANVDAALTLLVSGGAQGRAIAEALAVVADAVRQDPSVATVELLAPYLSVEDNDEALESAIEAVRAVACALPLAVAADRYGAVLVAGLDHPREAVRALTVTIVARGVAAHADGARAWLAGPLYVAVVQRLGDTTAVAAQVHVAIEASARAVGMPAIERLLQPDVRAALAPHVARDPTVQFRVYTVAYAVAATSADAATRILADGSLLPRAADLDVPDPLAQLNVVETLEQLLSLPGAAAYLVRAGLAERLHALLRRAVDAARTGRGLDALDNLLVIRALAVFGSVPPSDLRVWEAEAGTLGLLRQLLLADDAADLQQPVVTAVGRIGSVSGGLALLGGPTELLPADDVTRFAAGSVLEAWASLYGRGSPRRHDLRAAFHIAATALVATDTPDAMDAVEAAKAARLPERVVHAMAVAYDGARASWPRFDVVHRREAGARGRAPPPPYVLALLLDTDEEARYAAYGFLQSLVATAWGRALVITTPGALDHLLNRDNESEKAGLQWKAAVLSHLHAALRPGAPSAPLSTAVEEAYAPYVARVDKYVRDGPFYRGGSARVQDVYL